jgi:hypothetical protein
VELQKIVRQLLTVVTHEAVHVHEVDQLHSAAVVVGLHVRQAVEIKAFDRLLMVEDQKETDLVLVVRHCVDTLQSVQTRLPVFFEVLPVRLQKPFESEHLLCQLLFVEVSVIVGRKASKKLNKKIEEKGNEVIPLVKYVIDQSLVAESFDNSDDWVKVSSVSLRQPTERDEDG